MVISEKTLFVNVEMLRDFLTQNCIKQDEKFCFKGKTILDITIRMLTSVIKKYDNSDDYIVYSVLNLFNKTNDVLKAALGNNCYIESDILFSIIASVDCYYWLLKSRSEGKNNVKIIRFFNNSQFDSILKWNHPFGGIELSNSFFRKEYTLIISNEDIIVLKVCDPNNENLFKSLTIKVDEERNEPLYTLELTNGKLVFELNEYSN